MIHTSPYSVRRSASSFDFGGFSSEDCVAKEELFELTPASVMGATEVEAFVFEFQVALAVVEPVLEKEELAELILLSSASRLLRRTDMNFSKVVWTSEYSFFISWSSA
jgi:hypothetical protein